MTAKGRAQVVMVVALLAVALGTAAGGVWLVSSRSAPDPLGLAREAYDHGDWSGAEARLYEILKTDADNRDALRLLARSAARQGRDDAARRMFQRLGLDTLEPEDHVLLAKGLLREGRPDDARQTLQFALQDDINHAEARYEMARIELANGRYLGASSLVEPLETNSAWAVRAGVLLGVLADLAKNPAQAASALRNALKIDPTLKSATRSPVEARKLLARVLLKMGRPAEAREELQSLASTDPDAEISWLLSRALLGTGDIPAAAKALAESNGYGKDHPEAFEPAPYVGASRCAECHPSIHESQQSSHHAETFHRPETLADLPLPPGPVPDPYLPGTTHRLTRDGTDLEVVTRSGETTYQAIVKYVMGSGNHGRTLVGTDRQDDSMRELRLSHFRHGDLWDLTTGHPPIPSDPHDTLGTKQGDDSLRECLGCHTTNPRSIVSAPNLPEALDRGIGCERCHGPGGNHVAAMENGFKDLAIGRPRLAEASAVTTLCGQCHGVGSRKIPLDDEKTLLRFQATTLPRSRCVTASPGAISCVTCHDPHDNAESSPAFYEAKCLACHSPEPSHETAKGPVLPAESRRVACPVNPKQGCIDCHMPGKEGSMPHSTFTDHRIRVHRETSAR